MATLSYEDITIDTTSIFESSTSVLSTASDYITKTLGTGWTCEDYGNTSYARVKVYYDTTNLFDIQCLDSGTVFIVAPTNTEINIRPYNYNAASGLVSLPSTFTVRRYANNMLKFGSYTYIIPDTKYIIIGYTSDRDSGYYNIYWDLNSESKGVKGIYPNQPVHLETIGMRQVSVENVVYSQCYDIYGNTITGVYFLTTFPEACQDTTLHVGDKYLYVTNYNDGSSNTSICAYAIDVTDTITAQTTT